MRAASQVLTGLVLVAWAAMTAATDRAADPLAPGRALAWSASKGNCLACHAIDAGHPAGNVGPALQDLARKYRSKSALRAQIWDARLSNPESLMPPFGRNRLLTAKEIDQLVEYLWTL